MMKSMTGFASASHDDDSGTIAVTVRAVNHRFLDLQVRLPPSIADLEPRVRSVVQQRIARGRVEVQASLQARGGPVPIVELNEGLVRALTTAIDAARDAGLVSGALTPGDVLRLPQALSIRERPADQPGGQMWSAATEAVLARAVEALDEMRIREGGHLRADLSARKAALGDLIDGDRRDGRPRPGARRSSGCSTAPARSAPRCRSTRPRWPRKWCGSPSARTSPKR